MRRRQAAADAAVAVDGATPDRAPLRWQDEARVGSVFAPLCPAAARLFVDTTDRPPVALVAVHPGQDDLDSPTLRASVAEAIRGLNILMRSETPIAAFGLIHLDDSELAAANTTVLAARKDLVAKLRAVS